MTKFTVTVELDFGGYFHPYGFGSDLVAQAVAERQQRLILRFLNHSLPDGLNAETGEGWDANPIQIVLTDDDQNIVDVEPQGASWRVYGGLPEGVAADALSACLDDARAYFDTLSQQSQQFEPTEV